MSILVVICVHVESHGPDSAQAAIIEGGKTCTELHQIISPGKYKQHCPDPDGIHRVSMLAQGKVSLGELGAWQVALIREAQAIERERVAHAETEVHIRSNRPAGSVSAFAGGDE